MNNKRFSARKALPRRNALAIAMALGMGVSGLAFGQATTGTIFGVAPNAAGDTVTVVGNNNGVSRTVSVDAQGRYSVGNLPLGTYTVTLKNDGQVVSTRNNVGIAVGSGTEIDFMGSQEAADLGAVEVTANALPAIDVTSVSSSTVITAQQLEELPVAQSAEAIALLAPGTVAASRYYGNAVSFGGAGATENAYYVNGYNTTEPFNNTGGFQLPYGTIAQQQTFTGGYSAKYGRSDGGVINQVGKRGSNEWRFGGKVSWIPRSLRATPKNLYYQRFGNLPEGYKLGNPELQGKLRHYRSENTGWETKYSAYLGGPLIKDKLYMFVAGEFTENKDKSIGSRGGRVNRNKDHERNIYAKVDWNINDSNILELTSLQHTAHTNAGALYDFSYDTLTEGDLSSRNDETKQTADYLIAKYTGYLTDRATLSVLWGEGDYTHPVNYPFLSQYPAISGALSQNPAYLGGDPYRINDNPIFYKYLPDRGSHTRGLRADFTYQLGDHKLGVGIDNMWFSSTDQGQTMTGPGYAWIYSHTTAPNEPISASLGVGAPGEEYYVAKYIYSVASSMSMYQKAWYLQDIWNVTDTLQLNIGLRNDRFVNNNDKGVAFVDEDNQWEPRIGFSWDVNGDSSFKLYGNVGRYYLALPDSVAERAVNVSTYTREYYTYTGIDENGIPTGLTPVGGMNGAPPPGPVSSNHELGQNKDPNVVAPADLKAQYQDEYILGFDKMLGENWVWGAKAMYRDLKTSIDDVCDVGKLGDKIAEMGYDKTNFEYDNPGCRTFNPGETNTFAVVDKTTGDYLMVPMSASDWGFKNGATRKYYALNLYLEHPFDGKWTGRIDYTFARSWGNTEGQTRSDVGQTDVSKTMDWDAASLMVGSNGYLANHRRHSLKIRGAYKLTPEWLFSGTLVVQSGTPNACLGYFGPNAEDPIGYGNNYRFCHGQMAPRGQAGFTPWTRQLNLGVRYMPSFADQKLTFALDVHNVLNEEKALQVDPYYEDDKFTVNPTYGQGIYYETPRYIRLSVSYDY